MAGWQPNVDDYLQPILAQNPWHESGKVPQDFAPPRKRPLAACVWKTLISPKMARYQVIIGPRRVGKTVAMHQTVGQLLQEGIPPRKLWWLHLAHPILMRFELGELIRTHPILQHATQRDPVFFFLDELTYAENWDLWLKTFFDEQLPLRILATSSSSAALRQGRIESGIGRWEEQFLTPCLFTEYLHLQGKTVRLTSQTTLWQTLLDMINLSQEPNQLKDDRVRYLFVGGFPELLMQKTTDPTGQESLFDHNTDLTSEAYRSQRILRTDAIQRAIYQDIPQVFGVQNPINLERLLYILAGQITGIVSYTNLAKDVSVSPPTIDKYINYLERSHVVFLIPNYAPTEETIQRRGRKLYFVDSAVRNAALQRGVAPLDTPSEMGHLLENLVASHLFALSQQTGDRLYYWRKGSNEVDFIYDHPEEPIAIEIASANHHSSRGLMAFQKQFPKYQGRTFLVYPDARSSAPRPDGTPGSMSLDSFLIAVGVQADSELQKRMTNC